VAASSGQCLCGAVRYSVIGRCLRVAHCHCSMCRRISGAEAVTWVQYQTSDVHFYGTAPQSYDSSAGARRGFCACCGSALTYRARNNSLTLWLTLGSHDQPQLLRAGEHSYFADGLGRFGAADELPKYPGALPEECPSGSNV
jgi:hypothetical protein